MTVNKTGKWQTVIYKIENLVNGDIYIGSSHNFSERKNTHFGMLNRGKHHSPILQRAFIKYGKDNFLMSEIESSEFVSKVHTFQREQHYIDLLNPKYNICRFAGSNKGVFKSDVTKKAISSKHRGKKLTAEHRQKLRLAKLGRVISMFDKSVLQCSLDGTVIKKHDSIIKAAKETGTNRTSISAVLAGKYKKANRYLWKTAA